jgi:hypothetical protein
VSDLAIRRPKSLREVAVETETYEDFGMNLRDFLHEFARARERGQPLAPMLADEPPRIATRFPEGNICDAFIAGTADYLSRVNRIPTPLWAQSADRVLERPWFSEPALEARLFLLRDTPSAFKEKNIFVMASALTVA